MFAEINWDYWLGEQAIPVSWPWWSDVPTIYFYTSRLVVLLSGATVFVFAMAFALWCWGRWTGRPITLRD